MLQILFPFFCLFCTGLYLIINDLLKIPTLATTKAVIIVTRREKKQAKSLDAIILDIAIKLSKYIKLNDYKKRKMISTLKSADINLSPEVYISKAATKSLLIFLFIIPCIIFIPIISPIILFLSITIFFKEYKKADETVKKKREAIENELPRFVNTLTQELRASRDISTVVITEL